MYNEFFGLKEGPFSISPDPRYLFMSERHREALAHLLYGLGGGGGFVLLTGEIGAGKTTVCRCFLEQIPKNCNVAYIFNPKLTVMELLRSICDEFHIDYPKRRSVNATVTDYLDPLNEFLLTTHAAGQNNVLIIDEAQNLSAEVIEQLRLLTNLETSERKLLQIVLIGQPELRTLLARPDMEQLAQRVIARFHLPALSEVETAHYVGHRLAVGGRIGEVPFDRKAIQRIHRLSRGVPRRINLLCDRALLGAYATGKAKIGRDIVEKAAREVFDDAAAPQAPKTASDKEKKTWLPAQLERQLGHFGRYAPLALVGLGLVAGMALFGLLSMLNGSNPPQSAATTPSPMAKPANTDTLVSGNNNGVPSPAFAKAAAPATQPLALTTPSTPSKPPANTPPTAAADSPPPAAAKEAAAAAAPVAASNTVLRTFHRTENEAWRELAAMWRGRLDAGNPCPQLQQQQLECITQKGTLTTVKNLDRPAILWLYDGSRTPVYALLSGLSDKNATLLVNGAAQTVSLNALLQLWRGEFQTLWRTPPGYGGTVRPGSTGPVVNWLASRLALLQGSPQPAEGKRYDALLKSQVAAFQLTYGIKGDGVAGVETLMQLNRAIGIDEPRLITEK